MSSASSFDFSSSCATCSTRASVDRVAIRWIGVYMNRERKGCHNSFRAGKSLLPLVCPCARLRQIQARATYVSCRYVDEIQKLSRPFKYATPFPRGLSRVDVAERLRRQTANLIPSGCAGSNPVINVFFPSSTSPLFSFPFPVINVAPFLFPMWLLASQARESPVLRILFF